MFWKNGNKRREGLWYYGAFTRGTEYLEDGTKIYDGEFEHVFDEDEYGEEDENSDQDQNSKPLKA